CHQVWQPAAVDVDEDELPDRSSRQQGSALSAPQLPTLNPSTTVAPGTRLATSRTERKTASPHPASKPDRTRLPVNDQAEREETTRLMIDELSQRGGVVGAASETAHPQ